MAKNANTPSDLEDLISQLRKLGKHQYAQVISSASKTRKDASPRQAVSQIVNDDIQENLLAAGWVPTCPQCGSAEHIRNGKRNGLQRYSCRECGTRYTTTSGTLLEKSNYMWDVWVKVLNDLVNCIGIEKTQASLKADYGCLKIHKETIWSMRMKVLYAIWSIPSPKLHGTIQMDDTFFREGQKGAPELKNPLPKSANVERKPRYGLHPSLLGSLGPEFASTTCAVDNTGHCVIRSLSMGVPTMRQIVEFIEEHMENIAFLATDDDKTYRKAIRSLSLPHYICPSTRLSTLTEAGYTQLSKDPDKAAAEKESNRRIMERLWKNGELDFIEGVEARTYNQRCQLVKTYGLTISRVNSLHGRLDNFIKSSRRGVSTIYLPLYLALFEYIENRRADGKGYSTLSDAAEMLAEAVSTRAVFSGEVAAEWAAGKHAPDMASGVFVAKLMDETSNVRIATGNDNFKFNKTDGFRYISPRDLLLSLPLPTVKEMAAEKKIKVGEKSKSALVRTLLDTGDINELIAKYAYKDAATRIDDEDRELAASAVFAGLPEGTTENRTVLSATMPRMMFIDLDEAEHPAVFITVKTTGTNYETDEIIGFTAIDEDGEVLMDEVFKPHSKFSWYQKQNNTNHIKPSDVLDVEGEEIHHIEKHRAEIRKILDEAGCVVGWNLHFQLDMLHACRVDVPVKHKYADLSRLLYKDDRKPNKNRRNSFDAKAQAKLVNSIRHSLGEGYYAATRPLDDVLYIMRIWKAMGK